MKEYFDYICESSEVDTDDDALDVYNEMDAELCEFDSYVQEGVGVAIAAGVGGAALLGGLIALIAKCFGKSSPSSTSKAAKEAKKLATEAEAAGEEVPDIELPTVEAIEAAGEAVEKELDSVADSFEKALTMNSESNEKSETNSPPPIQVSKVESWEDTRNRFDAIENTSNKINQKQKVLKKAEQKVNRAQQNGAKLKPQQQNALKQKQGKAANNVTKTSASFMKGVNGFISNVKTKGKNAAKMVSDRLK